MAERGVFVMNLWWIAWWTWSLNGHVLCHEKCDTDSGFIFGGFVLETAVRWSWPVWSDQHRAPIFGFWADVAAGMRQVSDGAVTIFNTEDPISCI